MEWIHDSEKLPRKEGLYLSYDGEFYDLIFFTGAFFHDEYLLPMNNIYWMELIKPPNK
tara:strand:+ start:11 stop:184 length:174 start_codon:yes stop_codon:yes gene_type:complete